MFFGPRNRKREKQKEGKTKGTREGYAKEWSGVGMEQIINGRKTGWDGNTKTIFGVKTLVSGGSDGVQD